MTIDECAKMLIAKIECMKRETSGTDTDCNAQKCDDCSLCYEQGTIGQQKEALMYAVDIMRKYQMLQADYKARLKADITAMLDEIRLQAEENIENIYEKDEDDLLQLAQHNAFADCFEQYNDLIQQKVNFLKGDPYD